jgi:hypothetical protein
MKVERLEQAAGVYAADAADELDEEEDADDEPEGEAGANTDGHDGQGKLAGIGGPATGDAAADAAHEGV